MIIFPYRLRLRLADSFDLAKLLWRSVCDVGDGFKMRQQRAPPGCADAGNILKGRVHARFLPQIAVMGDAEPVRFVADALNQVQRRRLAVKQDAFLLIGQKDLLPAFWRGRKSGYRSPP